MVTRAWPAGGAMVGENAGHDTRNQSVCRHLVQAEGERRALLYVVRSRLTPAGDSNAVAREHGIKGPAPHRVQQ